MASQTGFSSLSASSIVPTERGWQFTKVGQDSFKAVSEKALSFHDAAETWVLRQSLIWPATGAGSTAGISLLNQSVPWGILKLNNLNCQQNMLFERFVFHHFKSMDLRIQVNGSPFQSGLLYAWFDPRNKPQAYSTFDIPSFDIIHRIPPHTNASYEFSIPFLFHRSRLNSNLTAMGEALGRFRITIIDPLFSTGTDVNISLFSKFTDYVCTVPRASVNGTYTLEGVGGSKPTTNVFNIRHSTLGSMPVEMNMSGDAGRGEGTISTSLPMDKPPLACGALPVFAQNPGMSNCVGVMPCTALQLCPSAMRPTNDVFCTDVDHLSIDSLMARKYQIYQRLWSDSDLAGTLLVSLPITPMPKAATNQTTPVENVKLCTMETIVDLASYWWGEITYEIMVIANNFHTGAIRVAYTYASNGLSNVQDADTTYNSTFDISNGNHLFTVTIPPNAGTDWLATEGSAKTYIPGSDNLIYDNAVPNRRLGYLNLYVLNPLRSATATVPPDCEIFIYITGKINLAVPRPFPVWGNSVEWNVTAPIALFNKSTRDSDSDYTFPNNSNNRRNRRNAEKYESDDDIYVLESPDEPGVTSVSSGDSAYGTGEIGNKNNEELHEERNIVNVADKSLVHSSVRFQPMGKFQFKITSLVDLFKRYAPIQKVQAFTYATSASAVVQPGSAYIIPALYPRVACSLMGGLKGGIHIRAMFRSANNSGHAGYACWLPSSFPWDYDGTLDGKSKHKDAGWLFSSLLAGIPSIGATFTRVTPPATKYTLVSQSSRSCAGARDVLFIDRHGMVDYYCPFQNTFDYWPMGGTDDSTADSRFGTLLLFLPTLTNAQLIGFWSCVGDDFAGSRFSPTDVTVATSSTFKVTGLVADDYPPLIAASTAIQRVA